MYGHVFVVFRNFIVEMHGGASVWETILSQAKCDEGFEEKSQYDDDLIDNVMKAAMATIGLPKEPFLEMLGEFYLEFMRENGYDQLLRNLGSNILEFLQNLDSVHCLARNKYPDMVAPSFRCDEDSVADRMILHYYSARKGLHSMVKGFTVAAAKIFYKMQLQMEVVSMTTETVAANQEREHVIFNIIARKIKEQGVEDGPPTFIAQTRKHGEQQILKEDVEAVRRKLEQIKEELGEDALPLMKKKSAKAKWRIAARITAMHKGFIPNYPSSLAVNPRMFIEIFPFHLIFDTELKVVQAGVKVQIMMPTIRSRQASLNDFFRLRYPNGVDLTYQNIQHFILTPFVLEMSTDCMDKNWSNRPALHLKGQMFLLRDSGYFIYVASPVTPNWEGLEVRGMKLAEIPMWDVTRDMLGSDIGKRVEVKAHPGLAMGSGERGHCVPGFRDDTSLDDRGTRERLQRTQRELENEKRKNTALYQAFLPKDVIDLVSRGQIPNGEYHTEATALFCDVVQFLPMVARCRPREVVDLLGKLQTKFDKVTKLHNTYRVESVGDAYLVVAGVEGERGQHAERIADTALDMLTESAEVTSPLDREPVLIRIGIHTGSLVTGVIGRKVPRYVVMGETSVVASKLESHGLPGKLHVSPTTYRTLENKGYVFAERGEIEIRNYGLLETYFLIGKEEACAAEFTDVAEDGNQRISYVSETRGPGGSPFEKRNRIRPTLKSPSSIGREISS